MKKTLLILAMVVSCMTTSCKKDNNDNNNLSNGTDEEQYTVNPTIEANSSFLFGTTWEHDKWERYNDKGTLEKTGTSSIDFTITFSSDILRTDLYVLDVNESYVPEMYTYWYVDENGLLSYNGDNYATYLGYSGVQVGQWMVTGGCIFDATIIKHSDKLILKDNKYGGGYELHYYSRVK